MHIRLQLLFTIVGVLCSTCQSRPASAPNRYGLYRLVVAGSTCYGPCPEFALDMDSSLFCTYYGGEFARHRDNYRGKVTEQFWMEAVNQINQLHLGSLPDTYAQMEDAAQVQFILYTSKGKKHFLGSDGALPEPLFKIYTWVIRKDSVLALRPVPDSISSDTFVQRPLPPPSANHRRNFHPPPQSRTFAN
ncbi:DUF6438 domain-containing protein [Hymenobacter pini]|uniref:DUF6438 domain-containing protein n=1 Tax=Hymenobacter pini TaxID=2880879 RepID=UPI001CF5B7E2|nr:DUF6438 domain-containing protein [Hymenobacter pini]